MRKPLRNVIVLLRVSIGWLFFYAGLSKVIDPSWTAASYLETASTLPELFGWLAQSPQVEWVNFLNEWGLLIIGVLLILGLFTRWASYAGIILMVLYWLPVLDFPYAGHGFIIDEHIMYALVFVVLISAKAGKFVGLDKLRKGS